MASISRACSLYEEYAERGCGKHNQFCREDGDLQQHHGETSPTSVIVEAFFCAIWRPTRTGDLPNY